jgi:hypothetical protein
MDMHKRAHATLLRVVLEIPALAAFFLVCGPPIFGPSRGRVWR